MAKNVTVQRIVSVLLHRVKFIILATVVMGLLFFMYSRFVIAPMYSTSTMIYVQNYSSAQRDNANTKATTSTKTESDSKKTSNEENQKIYPADISASANLAEICVTLFKNSDEMTALYAAGLTFLFSLLVNAVMSFKIKAVNMVESLKSVE